MYNYPVKYYDDCSFPVLLINEDIGLCIEQLYLTIGFNDDDLTTDMILKLKDDKINTMCNNVYDSLQKKYIDTKDSAYIMQVNFHYELWRIKIKGKYINPHK